MKKIKSSDFRAETPVNLAEISTFKDLKASEDELKKELEEVREKLGKFQDVLYAHGKYAVLVCIQGMDTAGKDSMIREVFKDFNTRGIVVHSFKVPTPLELKHDFLWRHYIALPARGKFSVFNRTHYENVLVTRVHPEYILNENIPGVETLEDVNDAFWHQRFEQIKNFEKHLVENGTIIFKLFLHLSKKEQRNRLIRRIDNKEKNWKFSPGDLKERKLWDTYQQFYEDAINRTSTSHAPWYIIPADNKDEARLIVADILYDELKEYSDIEEPELAPEVQASLDDYKKQLESEI
ncbi:polyphosphate:nucleotide phosphotransferase, PPK2 family [Zhouia amylolytica]|uniref:Polyphosphate:nucleotide phosphotransferase, PPK2 family n=1 Tax=Zhouia amylolytica TaxID=376730 RepID=A0A1I6RT14_9FLAO|nr:PPK2 family polyphosphate kinase [Zhouia amylolytica]MCQ0111916.1 polyphosphate kinase 2 family protein [Zhouia amylolytica]SFS67740.1 polyphosphate:nucleotide phosphotransferase, PPK2 family [Zhouia amylolytica]